MDTSTQTPPLNPPMAKPGQPNIDPHQVAGEMIQQALSSNSQPAPNSGPPPLAPPTGSTPPPGEPPKEPSKFEAIKNIPKKVVFGVAALAILLTAGLGVGLYLGTQQQDTRQQASGESCAWCEGSGSNWGSCPNAPEAVNTPICGGLNCCQGYNSGTSGGTSGGGTTGGTTGGSTGGGSTTACPVGTSSGTSFSPSTCSQTCDNNKQKINGGTVSGRKLCGKSDYSVPNCECTCSGQWTNGGNTCDGGQANNECSGNETGVRDGVNYQCVNGSWQPVSGGGSSGGTGGTGGSGSATCAPPNKTAGQACSPSCGEAACDGSGPLSCIVCPGGTAKSGLNVCSGFTSGAEVAADCGGYTTGNTSTAPTTGTYNGITCASGSQSNCSGKIANGLSTTSTGKCIASNNATGYCSANTDSTCSCLTADLQANTYGNDNWSCNTYNLYECKNTTNTSGGCQDFYKNGAPRTEAQDFINNTPVCTVRQADCADPGNTTLKFNTSVNNPGSSVCGTSSGSGTGTGTGTGTSTGYFCPNPPNLPAVKYLKFTCPNGCTQTTEGGVTAYRCYENREESSTPPSSLNGECGQIDVLSGSSDSSYCGYTEYTCNQDKCKGGSNPPGTPAPEPPADTFACKGIDASIQAPKIGDSVTFTCQGGGTLSLIKRYQFQYKVDDSAFTRIDVSSSNNKQSVSFPITKVGTYEVQCRACSDSACTKWDAI